MFACRQCRIRYACSLKALADPAVTCDDFQCLCTPQFSRRHALSRNADVTYRNLLTYVATRMPHAKLATSYEQFLNSRTSVVLQCTRCHASRRMQPRDVYGAGASVCTSCTQPPASDDSAEDEGAHTPVRVDL